MPYTARLQPQRPPIRNEISRAESRAAPTVAWYSLYYSLPLGGGVFKALHEERGQAMCQCSRPGKITMIKEKKWTQRERRGVPGSPVYPPLVSSSHGPEHITPIAPNRAMHQLTGSSVNILYQRHNSAPAAVSPLILNRTCFQACDAKQSSGPSIALAFSLPIKTKGQTNTVEERLSSGR